MYKNIFIYFLLYITIWKKKNSANISHILGFKPFVTSASKVSIITLIRPKCSRSCQDSVLTFSFLFSFFLLHTHLHTEHNLQWNVNLVSFSDSVKKFCLSVIAAEMSLTGLLMLQEKEQVCSSRNKALDKTGLIISFRTVGL